MKTYKIKPNKKQLKAIRRCWDMLQKKEEWFYGEVAWIEAKMAEDTGIEDIEFFRNEKCPWCKKDILPDGYCGVGNASRTMKLIQNLERGKG